MAEKLIFPSKRDTWIVLLSWIGAAIEVAVGLLLLTSTAPWAIKWLVPAACLAGAAFMLWVLYGTYYAFSGDTLVIRCGPFRIKVPVAEIEAVTPTRNPLSSPACSLDRLLIRYRQGKRRLMVSPLDQNGFLTALVSRGPHLSRSGLEVVRKRGA
ncbi:MAG: PH domain-containing protein [Syntrophobacterales bacterium]|nr:PH domain-containing protein [Syntrophobacterales bacterium]